MTLFRCRGAFVTEVTPKEVAIYARVSTHEQTAENQLLESRRYVEARGRCGVLSAGDWIASGAIRRHLVLLLDEWQSRGIAFVTLGEGIDTCTAAGRLVGDVLGSIASLSGPGFRSASSQA